MQLHCRGLDYPLSLADVIKESKQLSPTSASCSDDDDYGGDEYESCSCCGCGPATLYQVVDTDKDKKSVWNLIKVYMSKHRRKPNVPKGLNQLCSALKLTDDEICQITTPPVAQEMYLMPSHQGNKLDKVLCLYKNQQDQTMVVWVEK